MAKRSTVNHRDDFSPDPKLKFTFGLWTVGNIGRDPFGGPVREQLTPAQIRRAPCRPLPRRAAI